MKTFLFMVAPERYRLFTFFQVDDHCYYTHDAQSEPEYLCNNNTAEKHSLKQLAKAFAELRGYTLLGEVPKDESENNLGQAIARFITWSGWMVNRNAIKAEFVHTDGRKDQIGTKNFEALERDLTEAFPDWQNWKVY